jgi:hypothetical protein
MIFRGGLRLPGIPGGDRTTLPRNIRLEPPTLPHLGPSNACRRGGQNSETGRWNIQLFKTLCWEGAFRPEVPAALLSRHVFCRCFMLDLLFFQRFSYHITRTPKHYTNYLPPTGPNGRSLHREMEDGWREKGNGTRRRGWTLMPACLPPAATEAIASHHEVLGGK